MLGDQNTFLSKFNIDSEKFTATGLKWVELEEIARHHQGQQRELEQAAKEIADRLHLVEGVHSVRYRTKDAVHLVEKLIRKKIEHQDRVLTLATYQEEITDLVGVRVLHLFKDEWEAIHDYIVRTWDLSDLKPVAYYRGGDSDAQRARFEAKGCLPKEHRRGYRSVHYLIKTASTRISRIVEIQVRTLFEEGWSEIDHRVTYPYDADNSFLSPFLTIFNRLAGSADEMGSYVKNLSEALVAREKSFTESETRYRTSIQALEAKVENLATLQKKEKDELQTEIKRLSAIKREQQTLSASVASSSLFSATKAALDWVTTMQIPSIALGDLDQASKFSSSAFTAAIQTNFASESLIAEEFSKAFYSPAGPLSLGASATASATSRLLTGTLESDSGLSDEGKTKSLKCEASKVKKGDKA